MIHDDNLSYGQLDGKFTANINVENKSLTYEL
jgi:hypothetical protein